MNVTKAVSLHPIKHISFEINIIGLIAFNF